jgi:branched-chain amino acid transport system substrate-binding protein
MKKYRGLLVTGLLLGVGGCGGSTPAPIEIGHVSSRTENAGKQAELGLRLALNEFELSKEDLFSGRKIQIHHTDTQGKLEAFESQAVRLESVNRCVSLFGGLSTAETTALGNAKVPILTFSGQPAAGAGNNVFYLGMSPSRQGSALASVVADNAKVAKVLILADERRPESLALTEAFRKAWTDLRKKEAKAEPASVMRFSKDTPKEEFVERVQSFGPDAVVFAGHVQDFNKWHRTFRNDVFVGNPQVVFAGDDGDPRRLFEQDRDSKASILLASAFYADPASKEITAFTKAFRDAFQTEADVHAALAYDGLRILVTAMKETRTQLTPEKIREELLKTKNFAGLTGPLTFNADRELQRPVFVMRWQNGNVTLEKKLDP